jgi:glycerophosphoryl diester phosphodiesterase
VTLLQQKAAVELGSKIVPWTIDRSGRLAEVAQTEDYYYTTFVDVVDNDGDVYNLIDVLWRQAGIVGVFSDWSAIVSFYANSLEFTSKVKRGVRSKNHLAQ